MFRGRNFWPAQPVRLPEARCHLTFPKRAKQRWNRFQRLCGLLGFCSGPVATDGGLPKSTQHCTEEQDEKKEFTFYIVQVESVCWSATDINRATLRQTRHQRQAKGRVRRSQNAKTFGLTNAGLACTFCLWLPENQFTASNFTSWNQTWQSELHANGQRAGTTDLRLCVFIPSEAPIGQVYN